MALAGLLRDSLEVSVSVTLSNVAGLLNAFLVGAYSWLLLGNPEALALLPILASVRGGIGLSVASRVSTMLYLGVLEPSFSGVLRFGASRYLALFLASSLAASLLVWAVAPWLDLGFLVLVSVGSGFLVAVLVLAASSLVSTASYRAGLDPDNVSAPVVTSIADVLTVASVIALTSLASSLAPDYMLVASAFLAYLALSYFLARLVYGGGGRGAAFQVMASLLAVSLLEAYAGRLLVEYGGELDSVGLLAFVPPFLFISGSISSSAAARLSTTLHLYGAGALWAEAARRALSSVASLPLPLSITALATLLLSLDRVEPLAYLTVAFASSLLLTLFGVAVAALVTFASARAGADPDNVSIPLIMSIVDLAGIAFLAATASIIVG
ncbi:MAG: magnesium transporter [Desulfurococcales archaeon]|nr:magnesium transporter [Desulfurococcales archaeon]